MIERVFKARMLALDPVAVISLKRHDTFGRGDKPVGRHESNDTAQARIGTCISVGCAHAAANCNVETLKLSDFPDGNEPKILGERSEERRVGRKCGIQML